jgi:outer membrane protein TolC
VRAEGRAALLLVAAGLAGGCGVAAHLARPEGTGGWSAARRETELGRRAAAAGVDLEAAGAPAPPVPDAALTLEDALRLAATRNRRIALAERQLRIEGARVRQARARLLPSVTGSGRYTWYTDPQTNAVDVPSGLLPRGSAPLDVVIREDEEGRVNGTLTVPLDVWGEAHRALGAAQAGYRGERARVWATRLGEQVAVVRAYFDLLEAERLHEVTTQSLAAQRTQLANTESRFRSGRLTKNELLVVQVAVLSSEQQLVQRQLAIDAARWRLNRTVGLDVDAPTRVVDLRARPGVPPLGETLREAYRHNPALAALVEEQQRLEDAATALVRGRLPRFSGGAAIDWTSSDVVQPQRIGSGFVGFTWDLGTDGRREAEIAAAHQAVERNRIAIEAELRALENAVRAMHGAVAERLAALAAAEAAVGQAEENLRIREQQFGAGRAASEDVLDAEALLTEQRATLASALYQAHTRLAELRELMGEPLDAGADGER